jgi:pilus assembly protein Flp/PilA
MSKTNRNKKERGQGLVEYALILVLATLGVIAVLMLLGPIIGGVFSTINDSLSSFGGGEEIVVSIPTDPPAPCASTPAFESWKSSVNSTCSSYSGTGNWVAYSCDANANVTSATCWYDGDGFNTPKPANLGTFNH